jgi:hypothetical protein
MVFVETNAREWPAGQMLRLRKINETRNITRKMTNRILAMPTAAPASPEKPSRAAMSANIRNVSVQLNIIAPQVIWWMKHADRFLRNGNA